VNSASCFLDGVQSIRDGSGLSWIALLVHAATLTACFTEYPAELHVVATAGEGVVTTEADHLEVFVFAADQPVDPTIGFDGARFRATVNSTVSLPRTYRFRVDSDLVPPLKVVAALYAGDDVTHPRALAETTETTDDEELEFAPNCVVDVSLRLEAP
jgi:hypothetical protein